MQRFARFENTCYVDCVEADGSGLDIRQILDETGRTEIPEPMLVVNLHRLRYIDRIRGPFPMISGLLSSICINLAERLVQALSEDFLGVVWSGRRPRTWSGIRHAVRTAE